MVRFLCVFPTGRRFTLLRVVRPKSRLGRNAFANAELSRGNRTFAVFGFRVGTLRCVNLTVVKGPGVPGFGVIVLKGIHSALVG